MTTMKYNIEFQIKKSEFYKISNIHATPHRRHTSSIIHPQQAGTAGWIVSRTVALDTATHAMQINAGKGCPAAHASFRSGGLCMQRMYRGLDGS